MIGARIFLLQILLLLSACSSVSDRPSARPDDQPRIPVNRSGTTLRPDAMLDQSATAARA